MAADLDGAPVFMASSEFTLNYEIERAPKIAFSDIKDYQRHDAVAA
jgi:peptide chain release factor 3